MGQFFLKGNKLEHLQGLHFRRGVIQGLLVSIFSELEVTETEPVIDRMEL